ncbi:MAG: GGDEF domain-containing protein [Chloroflexota bacterium]|nr:GGDEF domain-containing protein [Chloroflexota bacterium]
MAGRLLPASVPLRQLAAFAMASGMVVLVELTGRQLGLEPALLLPLVVGAATFIAGISGGLIAGAVGGAYTVLYYSQPAWGGSNGGVSHAIATVTAAALAAVLAARVRDQLDAFRANEAVQADFVDRVTALTDRLAHEPFDSMPDVLAIGAASLLDADMAVLTILDPPTGRHFVRAVFGGSGSALGVEVLPGVGITGQAIRQRQVILAGAAAALPALQAGRVIATITLGRNERKAPFGASERKLLEGILPVVTLAAAGTLARREGDDGVPRDGMTGVFNHAYLDAALDQLLALRRRTPPQERVPLAMLMFDVDSFRSVNERYGRPVGDNVLRAVATLIRQRFRASDIIARVGPDSFFVVLNGATPEIAADAAAQIRRQVRDLNMFGMRGEPVVVSVSAGVAMYRDGDHADALFKSVEAALETARWSGPGAVVSI